MYARDMPIIRAHALAGPAGFADVCTFVLLTIQQHLTLVPGAMESVRQSGQHSTRLFGAKRAGWVYVMAHKKRLYAMAHSGDTVALMDALLEVPSLGLVKAGFVCQLLGHEVGCIDTHNLLRLGLNENSVRFHKSSTMRPATRRKRIEAYITLCKRLGGAEKLWDDWCAYVANPEARNSKWRKGFFTIRNPSDVSRLHVLAIGATECRSDAPF